MQDYQIPKIDLSNCEKEPILIPGKIHGHGFLIAISPTDFKVLQHSQNAPRFLNTDEKLLGKPIEEVLGDEIKALMPIGMKKNNFLDINPYPISIEGIDYNLIGQYHDELIILEIEPIVSVQKNFQVMYNQALSKIQTSATLEDLLEKTAAEIKTITQYDRVMIYRFDNDWNGEVVAEAREDHLEPYLGLYYPASDIPRQAREAFFLNQIRIIPNVNEETSLLEPLLHPIRNDQPLDLTYSVLRASSPIHLQYLRNMGVSATLTLALIHKDKLWGLIACHHYSPKFIDYTYRNACKFLGQLFSSAVENKQNQEENTNTFRFREIEEELSDRLMKDNDMVIDLTEDEKVNFLEINKASGGALFLQGKVVTMGETPDVKDLENLRDWILASTTGDYYHTDCLPKNYKPSLAFKDNSAGLLTVTVSRELREMILWFKPERIKTVSWGGNPEKAIEVSEDGIYQLSPRRSFAKWEQEVHLTSEPWTETEVSLAVKLNEDIRKNILRRSNEIRRLNERLNAAYNELDAFSYTISHDLRNPLSIIQSLTELLEEEIEGKDVDLIDITSRIKSGVVKMRNLINDVLEYSKIGRQNAEMYQVDIQEVVHEITNDAAIIYPKVAIESQCNTPIYGNQSMLYQLFSNLINNAAKYSSSKPDPKVTITCHGKGDEVIYEINDNGIGMDMKFGTKVFELFRRLENARGFSGTGVGLAIAKKIVDSHNGRIWFQSKLDEGTTFFVSLPKQTKLQNDSN